MIRFMQRVWRRFHCEPDPVAADVAAGATVCSAVTKTTRFRRPPFIEVRERGPEMFVVHLVDGAVFRLNNTGKMVWEQATAHRCVGDIVHCIAHTWSLAPESVETDVRQLLNALLQHSLLELDIESAA